MCEFHVHKVTLCRVNYRDLPEGAGRWNSRNLGNMSEQNIKYVDSLWSGGTGQAAGTFSLHWMWQAKPQTSQTTPCRVSPTCMKRVIYRKVRRDGIATSCLNVSHHDGGAVVALERRGERPDQELVRARLRADLHRSGYRE